MYLLTKIGEGLDYFFNKVLPKKLLVFIIACLLVFMDKITGEQWFWIAAIYLGMNTTAKLTGGMGNFLNNRG